MNLAGIFGREPTAAELRAAYHRRRAARGDMSDREIAERKAHILKSRSDPPVTPSSGYRPPYPWMSAA